MVHGGAHQHLGGLQFQMSRWAAVVENHTQQLAYFARDLLLDRFGRFFSWADGWCSSTGRNWQTCSLTYKSLSPSSRKRWHSATSRCAMAKPAGEENVS